MCPVGKMVAEWILYHLITFFSFEKTERRRKYLTNVIEQTSTKSCRNCTDPT